MKLSFYKYQGAGNDFVMIDNRQGHFKPEEQEIARLCDRRFGVGADGLILLQAAKEKEVDFQMVYFNADGRESTMCGNGGRCVVHFAHALEIFTKKTTFVAIDGKHQAEMEGDDEVCLQMQNVSEIQSLNEAYFLDTGSPHHVVFVSDVDKVNVRKDGAEIRHSERYAPDGTNVNFAELRGSTLFVRTFERGVEDETLACGTGVTAVALAAHFSGRIKSNKVAVQARGGKLSVSFKEESKTYKDLWLKGPAKMVYKGTIAN